MRNISYSEAVNEAIHEAMKADNSVICYGLGATDPKAIFGTTRGLADRFGSDRVFDTPTSENAMTGIGVGAAIAGSKVLMTHQRLDFFLLAMDQLVNSAAKWHYMFGSQVSVPITIRLIVGRGWGQGPTHSQNLQAWFAHVPGLKVIIPTSAADAKGMLFEAILDPDPVVMIEHRWLHNSIGDVPAGKYSTPLGKAKIVKEGADATIVALSYLTLEALRAEPALAANGISAEIIDLRSANPIDWPTIKDSVRKTGRLVVADTGFKTCSIASELIARISLDCFSFLKAAPQRVAMPDVPEPTSFGLTENFYVDARDICRAVSAVLSLDNFIEIPTSSERSPHDVPGDWFQGPF
jgi:pyruvate dehydrogenase E1 component beta subunit